MTRSRFLSNCFFLLGILSAAVSVAAALYFLEAPPILLGTPQTAGARVEELMDDICRGEFDNAQQLLYGSPELELDMPHADAVGDLLWDAYLNSVSYELVGQCYATETGLSQQVRFRSLDISSVTNDLSPVAREILLSKLEDTRDSSQIYDENQNYREDLIANVLSTAAQQVLSSNPKYKENTFVLQLIQHQGEWLVIPDATFLSVISGGITG